MRAISFGAGAFLAPFAVEGAVYAGPTIATTAGTAFLTHAVATTGLEFYETYRVWDQLSGAQRLQAIGVPIAAWAGGLAGVRAVSPQRLGAAALSGGLRRFSDFGYRSYLPSLRVPTAIRLDSGRGFVSLASLEASARFLARRNAPNTGKLVFDPATRSWTSPGGLVYGQGSVHGNRVKHVLFVARLLNEAAGAAGLMGAD